jgi:streptothricin acetyltransferase
MFCIAELPADQAVEWSARDRTFVVESELKLHLVQGLLSYEAIAVTPYEKTYSSWRRLPTGGVSFVGYVGDRIAAEIDLVNGWNGYAQVENLVVAQESRRQGLARALVERAVAWAESKRLPGVMLETQNNNISACHLYESCGFKLEGFDSSLNRGLNQHSQEVALFWYCAIPLRADLQR